jgi:AraC-like DNA-binding protein
MMICGGDGAPLRGGDSARYRLVNGDVELFEAAFERHVYERHIHEAYAIGVTLRGVQRFWCRGATRDSTAGTVIVIGPGEVHDGESGAPGGYAYRMLYVSIGYVEHLLADAGGRRGAAIGARVPVMANATLARQLDAAWRAGDRSPGSLAAGALLDESLLSVAARNGFGGIAGRVHADPLALKRVRDYLHEHVQHPVGVHDLAALASMSRFQLTRQFQQAYGLPLHAYHLHVRLEVAKRELSQGAAIASVAANLGFADQSHLNRRFKGAFGVTPGEWRRSVRPPG